MKLSFTTMGTPELDHRGAIEMARSFGYQGIDIRCSTHKGEVELDSTPPELQELASDFQDAGLVIPGMLCYNTVSVQQLGAHFSFPTAPQGVWDDVQAELRRHLELGAAVGAHAIRIFAGKLEVVDDVDAYMTHLAACVRKVLDDDQSEVAMIVQNHGGSFDGLQCAQFAQRVGRDRFGIVYSPDHTLMMEEGEWDEVLEAVAPYTRELYIADLGERDGEREPVLPGKGEVPLGKVIRFFRDSDFDGFYTFKWEKIWNDQIEEPETALPHYVRFMESVAG